MTSRSQSREFPPSRLSHRMVLAGQWREPGYHVPTHATGSQSRMRDLGARAGRASIRRAVGVDVERPRGTLYDAARSARLHLGEDLRPELTSGGYRAPQPQPALRPPVGRGSGSFAAFFHSPDLPAAREGFSAAMDRRSASMRFTTCGAASGCRSIGMPACFCPSILTAAGAPRRRWPATEAMSMPRLR